MAHEQANSNIGHNIYEEKTLWILMCAIAPEPLLRPEKGGSVDCSYHHLVVVIVCLYAGCCSRRILDFWACLHHPITHDCHQRMLHISHKNSNLRRPLHTSEFPHSGNFCIFQEITLRIL